MGNGTSHGYTPNNLNQIESMITLEGPFATLPVELTYDLAGNLLDNGEGKTFEWDAANRLTAINNGSQRSEFTYDGLSRRVKIVEKTGSTVTSTKQFVWVGSRIAQERDEQNTITRQYFMEGECGEKKFYYTRDHLGSIRELTGVQGEVLVRYDYDPYGQRTKLSGASDVDFGYTGHYHHAPSGLNLTLYRAYNPAMGRWLSRDPLDNAEMRQGANLYWYVGNSPLAATDPLGLFLQLQDVRDIWSTSSWWLPRVAMRLEGRHGSHGAHGGALSHCIFHCLFRRGAGPASSYLLVSVHNWAFENPNNPFPAYARLADVTSPTDRAANDKGRKCAKGKDSCVEECLKQYP